MVSGQHSLGCRVISASESGEKKLTNLEDNHKTRTRTPLRHSFSTSVSKHRPSQISRLADRRGGEQRHELAWLEFFSRVPEEGVSLPTRSFVILFACVYL